MGHPFFARRTTVYTGHPGVGARKRDPARAETMLAG